MDDRILLAVMKHRAQYEKLLPYIRLEIQEPYTRKMIEEFGLYFKEQANAPRIDTAEFFMWQVQFRMKRVKEEDRAKLKAVLQSIEADPDGDTRALLLKGFQEREFATKANQLIQRWDEGGEVELFDEMVDLYKDHSAALRRQTKDPWVKVDFQSLFDIKKMRDSSFEWAVPELNVSIGPAPLKQFYLFGGRPDAGKTTFIAQNINKWGREAMRKWGLKRPIIIFNNEGDTEKYQRRMIQSGLNMTTFELIDKGWEWCREQYNNTVCPYGNDNSADDMIRIMQVQGYSVKDLEFIIEEQNPCVVIYDMLDNVRGFESIAKYGTVDTRYEYLYQWARETAVDKDHFALGTSQLNGSAEGEMWPRLDMMKGSTTAKQGACDVIIFGGRGAAGDPSRYISTPKNKSELRDPGSDPWTMATVCPDFARGQYCKPINPVLEE